MLSELKAEIDAIRRAHGSITAEAMITHAWQHPDGLLYRHFEWNNADAAHQFRLEQARSLIREYKVVKPDTNLVVRGFLSIPASHQEPRRYLDYSTAAGSETLRLQIAINLMQRHVSEMEDLRFTELAGQLSRSKTLLADLKSRLERLRDRAA
jgi:hypothetical protein